MKKYAIMDVTSFEVDKYVEDVEFMWSYNLGSRPYYYIRYKDDNGNVMNEYGSYNYKNIIKWFEKYFIKFYGMTCVELALFISDAYCVPYNRVVEESFSEYNMNDCLSPDEIDAILTSYEIDEEEN